MGLLTRIKYLMKRLWTPTKAAAKQVTPDKVFFHKRTAPLVLYDWQDSVPPSQTIGSCQQLLPKLIFKKVRIAAPRAAWLTPRRRRSDGVSLPGCYRQGAAKRWGGATYAWLVQVEPR